MAAPRRMPWLEPAASRRLFSMISAAIRPALAALVVWLACSTGMTFLRLLHDVPDPAANDAATPAAGAGFDWSRIADPGGSWRLNDLGWTLALRRLPTPELDRFWAVPPIEVAGAALPGELENALVQGLRASRLAAEVVPDGRRYAVDSATLRAIVRTTTVGDRERLVAARLAVCGDDRLWTVVEAVPGPTSADRPAAASLLPYPNAATPAAARLDASGDAAAEFVRLKITPAALVEFWRSAGCEPQAAPGSTFDGFAEFALRHSGRAVRAAVLHSADDGTTMVVAAPSIADVSPLVTHEPSPTSPNGAP